MYLCIYDLRIYVSMYLCIYVSMYLCIYVSMYVCMSACMYVCMYVCMYTHIDMYIYIYVYIIYIHTYIYIAGSKVPMVRFRSFFGLRVKQRTAKTDPEV